MRHTMYDIHLIPREIHDLPMLDDLCYDFCLVIGDQSM